MSKSPAPLTAFRFTKEELEDIRQIGEMLTEEGVFGLKTPVRGVNLSAVLRYLVHKELQRLGIKPTPKTKKEGDEQNPM